MSEFKKMDDVDSKFDRAEKVWDRLQKLLLKIVGGVVGITLAIYIAYGQLKDKHEEHFEKEKIEHAEELKKYKDNVSKKDTSIEHSSPYNNTINYKHIQKEDYMLLSRLQSDCEYFLGSGNRDESVLFHGNVREHIQSMKELWIGLEKKPEWLNMKDIISYERKMKNPVIFTPDTDTDVVNVDGVFVEIQDDSDIIVPKKETKTKKIVNQTQTQTETDDILPTVVESKKEVEEEKETKPKYFITKKTWDIDTTGERKGDTIYIDYYSDGYIEKYYTDGTSYPAK